MNTTNLRRLIKSGQAMMGYDNETMAKGLGFSSKGAWEYKLRYPERIKVQELQQIERLLKIRIFAEIE